MFVDDTGVVYALYFGIVFPYLYVLCNGRYCRLEKTNSCPDEI